MKGVDKPLSICYNKGTKNKGVATMKTYLCDYSVATFSTIETIVEGAFHEAVVRCEDVNEEFFEAHI